MPLLRPGETCWELRRARRLAVIVDGAAYFRAVAEAIARARRAVWIVGWDLDLGIDLVPEGAPPRDRRGRPLPTRLGELLDAVARRHRVHSRLLVWDLARIVALGRGIAPVFELGRRRHPRVRLRLDGELPPASSHHQKIVVVDGRVAFAGGIDLTAGRWDRPGHAPHPARSGPPWHDVQVAVDGEAAGALAELVRRRWRRATGRRLRWPGPVRGDPWPPGLEPDLRDVEVGIARTEPAWRGRAGVREVERLWAEAIATARRTVYVENQFFTAHAVGRAIERRLCEPGGPEFVVVVPHRPSGWLEAVTMGVLRDRLLQRLRAADAEGRLRVYHPRAGGRNVVVHAKVLVVDDRLLRVGSANLSNRSLGVDTECDLAVEARTPEERAAVRGVRNRLVAEHLGRPPAEVAAAEERAGSLGAAVEALRSDPDGPGPTLVPEDGRAPAWMHELVPGEAVFDPERPASPEELVAALVPRGVARPLREPLLVAGGMALLAAAVAAFGGPVDPAAAAGSLPPWARPEAAPSPLLTLPLAVAALLLAVPLHAVAPALAWLHGAAEGGAVGLLAWAAAALLSYGAGRVAGREAVRRLAGPRVNPVSRVLARRGVLPVIAVRLVPRLPGVLVGMLAGAARVPLPDYVVGSVLGVLPSLGALTAVGALLARAVRTGRPDLLALGLALGGAGALLAARLRRWIDRLDAPARPSR